MIFCASFPEDLEVLQSCRLGVGDRAGDDLMAFFDLLRVEVRFSESVIAETKEAGDFDSF